MNRGLRVVSDNQTVCGGLTSNQKMCRMIGTVLLATTLPAVGQNPELQQKLAAVKQSAAMNKQELRQVSMDGDNSDYAKRRSEACIAKALPVRADGQVQKTPIGPPPQHRAAAE